MDYRCIFLCIVIMAISAASGFLTCKDLKSNYPTYQSGIYEIYLPSGQYKVYCEMAINGGGYTFIPPSMISKLTPNDLRYLVTDNKDVLLRISRPDGTQPYTVVSQYIDSGGLSVQLSAFAGHQRPFNTHLGPYIYLGTLPASKVSKSRKLGFKSNGKDILYDVCGRPKGNYFAFYSYAVEKPMSSYHKGNLVYEKIKVAVDWRKSAKRPYSGRRMPLDYFLFTELHYDGCGCYTTSDRWLTSSSPAHGTALGLR